MSRPVRQHVDMSLCDCYRKGRTNTLIFHDERCFCVIEDRRLWQIWYNQTQRFETAARVAMRQRMFSNDAIEFIEYRSQGYGDLTRSIAYLIEQIRELKAQVA